MAFFGWIQFLDNDEGLVELSLTIKIFLTRLVLNSQPWSERLLFRSVEGREEKLRIKTCVEWKRGHAPFRFHLEDYLSLFFFKHILYTRAAKVSPLQSCSHCNELFGVLT
jgi:hypothetical protein